MTIEGLSLIALVVALAGGVVSFVSPCVLPLVPIYLGHLSGVSVVRMYVKGVIDTALVPKDASLASASSDFRDR